MSTPHQTDERARQSTWVGRPIEAIRGSVLLKLATVGVGFIALAVALQLFVVDPANPGLAGIWTAMLPIWGTALIITGLGGYGFITYRRR